jgi:hypothetical protein
MATYKNLYVQSELFVGTVEGATINPTQWGYLGGTDQALSVASSVQFDTVTISGAGSNTILDSAATGGDYTIKLPAGIGAAEQRLKVTDVTLGVATLDWVDTDDTFDQPLNTTDAVQFAQVTVDDVVIDAATITFGGSTTGTNNLIVSDNQADAFSLSAGALDYMVVDSTDGAEVLTLPQKVVTIGDFVVGGDLTVAGLTTIINSTELAVVDPIIELNKNDGTPAGVGNGTGHSGLIINRGTLPDVSLAFYEATDRWKLEKPAGGVFGEIATTVDGDTKTTGTIPAWDANGDLKTADGLDATQVTQLKTMGNESIDASKWTILGAAQGIATTDAPTFAGVTLSAASTVNADIDMGTGANIGFTVSSEITTSSATVGEPLTRVNTGVQPITLTLPTLASALGKTYRILRVNTSANTLTIIGAGGETIEDDPNIILTAIGQHVSLVAMPGNWIIV